MDLPARRPPTKTAPARAPASTRDPWADNARLVAATLIVVMHLLEPVLARSGSVTALYWATWPLRVPLFVVVAGYFSDARPLDDRRTVTLLRRVLAVYLVWDAVAFVRRGIVDDLWRYEPTYPAFGLWFLLALLWWRLSLPLIARVRAAGVLVWVLALGSGFMPQLDQGLAGSRTFAYLPLFWLGWRLRQLGARERIGSLRARLVGAVGLMTAAGGMLVLSQRYGRGLLRFAGPYGGGWEQQLGEAGLRGVVLALGILGALGALALVPVGRVRWWTTLGAGSMTVYVVHPVLVQDARSRNLFDAVQRPVDLVVLGVLGVALALALASPPVRAVLRPLVQPRGTWWVAPPPAAPPPAVPPFPAVPPRAAPTGTPSEPRAPAPGIVSSPEGTGAADAAVPAPGRDRGIVLDGVVDARRREPGDERDELKVVGGAADDPDTGDLMVHDAHAPAPQSSSSSSSSRSRSRLTDQPSTT